MSAAGLGYVALLMSSWAVGYCAGAALRWYERFVEKAAL